MSFAVTERLRALFKPPRYIALPLAGIDLSTSSVKAVQLRSGMHGLTLANYAEVRLPSGAYVDGEIIDREAIIAALIRAAHRTDSTAAHVSFPESKSPADAGVGEVLALFDEAGITVRSLEREIDSVARAVLPQGDDATVLIIDIGKTTTKLSIVAERLPRFDTTIPVGGHALTLAVQKYFGVTEAEARKVKADCGIVATVGNEAYLAAMLGTISVIREEIYRHLTSWQKRVVPGGRQESVARAVIVGGNASVRGLPEYLEGTLRIPIMAGDVFTNLAPRDTWVPALDYTESLSYATAIGLALRDHTTLYAD